VLSFNIVPPSLHKKKERNEMVISLNFKLAVA